MHVFSSRKVIFRVKNLYANNIFKYGITIGLFQLPLTNLHLPLGVFCGVFLVKILQQKMKFHV